MPAAEYRVTLAQDKASVRIEVLIGGELQAWSNATAGELSGLINLLTSFRGAMADAVPMEPDPKARMTVVADPCWQAGVTEQGELAFRLRHPGAGWTEYRMPAASAGPLTDVLERLRKDKALSAR